MDRFDLPQALFWTAVSGRETPAVGDLGGTMLRPKVPGAGDYWPVGFCERDGWLVMRVDSEDEVVTNRFIRYYRPVRPMPRYHGRTRHALFAVLRAPFPLTVDSSLTLHSTCSLGHVDDPPFMPPYTGRPSARMVELMNGMTMKPGWIVWDGYLHVWVNYLYWRQSMGRRPAHTLFGVSVPVELALFRAYRAYYEQLRCELPYPYAEPVLWPDQCDPRFPLPSDPRYGAYA
ncbi:hypothetical protein [Bifidobacterium parmae]|nr:hypothetical protein [Bifidobacterium parmae]